MITIKERILGLRKLLVRHKIDAYLVQSTDEHQNEYTPEHAKRRQWISGFTGSAGDFVVTRAGAFLWTDSRYYLQAEDELSDTEIELLRAGALDYSDIYDWIISILKPGNTLGVDPNMITYEDALSVRSRFQAKKIKLQFIEKNLIDILWKDKPKPQSIPAEVHSVRYCGEDYRNKLKRLRDKMREIGCDFHIIGSLDSIGWLLNIRGHDIPFNPLLISYLIITDHDAHLFTEQEKMTAEMQAHLVETVKIHPYDNFAQYCKKIVAKKHRVWIDPKRTSYAIATLFYGRCEIYINESPVYYYKALKNSTEVSSLQESMIRDGVAIVKFLTWLEKKAPAGNITEESAAQKLEEFRQAEREYRGPSFYTISAFNAHGAIVHYSYNRPSSIPLTSPGVYLIDSGAHYFGGTTDITRTIAIGTPTTEQKDRYTRVLKGHIQLAMVYFPKGTKGVQLDTLARKPLWDMGLDYGHGTGHGVGFYLNVHEGPHSISSSKLSSPGLEPGMLVTDEPGYYKQGEYGIRIENILLVESQNELSADGTPFYYFRTLTLCPYDRNLIDASLLTQEELMYVEVYHKKVKDSLLSHLINNDEKDWLTKMTAPLIE